MRYWPLSAVIPHLPPHMQAEVARTDWLSNEASLICGNIVDYLPPTASPNLGLIVSIGSRVKRMYHRYPTTAEWMALERGGVTFDGEICCAAIDELH